MKPFTFKQFKIEQSKDVFRVGTDGVLLGALADVHGASSVLEVGTGTGLISLMLAQRNPQAYFLGLDINEDAAALTKLNFENAPFHARLKTGIRILKLSRQKNSLILLFPILHILKNQDQKRQDCTPDCRIKLQTVNCQFGAIII